MNITVYIPSTERKTLKAAKQAAKQNNVSISRVVMGAIRAYVKENEVKK